MQRHAHGAAHVEQAHRRRQHRDDGRPVLALAQNYHGLQNQQRQVDEDAQGVELHPQQPAGVDAPQDKHHHVADEAGVGCAHAAPAQDEEVVQHAVGHRAGEHGVQRQRAALFHHVNAVQELVEAAEHRGHGQHRHKLPGGEEVLAENAHQRLAQPDDARRAAEHHALVDVEHLAEKGLSPLLLGHGGELPRLIEDCAQRDQNGGQEVAGAQQARPVVAAVSHQALDEEQVAGVDDPEADLGRNQGDGVAEHLHQQLFVEVAEVHIMGHVAHNEHEHGAGGVAANDGQQVALRAQVKPKQKDHVVQQRCRRTENAVHRHQAVQLAAAHQLAGEGTQAAHQHVDV